MSVKELALQARASGIVGFGLGQNFLRRAFATKQREHFHHRNAAIAHDRDQLFLRLFNALGACQAQEMPHGIFHVVAVHCLVAFELLVAFLEFVGVIIADAALPMMRILTRHVLQIGIKVDDGFLDLSGLEIRLATFLM